MIINLTFKLHFFFISLSTTMSLWPGVDRIELFIWLFDLDWWPGIGMGGGMRNAEFSNNGCKLATTGCEFGCCAYWASFQSCREPLMSIFLRCLPVVIFFELCLRRFSVLPLFSATKNR